MTSLIVSQLRSYLALPPLLIVVVEVVKAVIVVRAFRKSADGNILGAVFAAEGVSFMIDAAIICLTVFPFEDSRLPALYLGCAAFLLTRVASSVILSRTLRK